VQLLKVWVRTLMLLALSLLTREIATRLAFGSHKPTRKQMLIGSWHQPTTTPLILVLTNHPQQLPQTKLGLNTN
jgi:hypothetical protein